MDGVKKMVLLPHSALKSTNDSPIVGTHGLIDQLDNKMHSILSDKRLSPSEKWNRYSEALNQYLHFVDEHRKPVGVSVTLEQPASSRDVKQDTHLRETLQRAVPIMYRKTAQAILDELSVARSQELMTWDENGQLIIRGKTLPGTNVVDIISDLCRSRKNFVPEGREQVREIVKDLHLPRDLVRNAYYHESQSGSGQRAARSPPQRSAANPSRSAAGASRPRSKARARPVKIKPVAKLTHGAQKKDLKTFIKWKKWSP